MMSTQPLGTRASIYGVFVSLTIAMAALGILVANELVSYPFLPIQNILIRAFPGYGGLNLATGIAFLLTAMLYAVCIFVLLRLTARTSLTRGFLRFGSGAVVLAAPLACWFLMVAGYPPVAYLLLAAETAFGIFSIYYLLGKTGSFGPHVALILALHSGIWIWMFWRAIPNPVAVLIPALATAASVTWVYRTRAHGFES